MSSYYLTTPIYYVNGYPHLGHAYTTIVTDVYTRFLQRMGNDAMFITGTDEHGDKIVQAAEKAGQTPEVFTTTMSNAFRKLWPELETNPSEFVRTTSPEHKANVQAFLQKVYDAGDIYFGEYGGHYCLGCERFYTEKELENGMCPQHLTKPEYISEKNYFFRMGKYQGWLKDYILENPDFIRPERYRSEVLALLDSSELDDLCISRPKSRLTWGIELPFDDNYVCYVWFDALLSYITALGGPNSAQFEKFWPHAEHVVAKDILKPHAIFWPTMLKAAGLPMFKHLNVHGYWLVKDMKMSKSLGNVIVPLDMAKHFGIDPFRYFLLKEMHFGGDASFSEEGLISKFNADLANDLGNLFSRVLSMTVKYCNGVIPAAQEDTALETNIKALAQDSIANYQSLFMHVKFSHGLEALWELVRGLNKYVDSAAPWTLAKNNDTQRLATVLYTLLECMRKVAVHLLPVMPEKAAQMLAQLGINNTDEITFQNESQVFGLLQSGVSLPVATNLFPRLEVVAEDQPTPAQKEKVAKTTQPSAPATTEEAIPVIEFADFQKIDMRIGTVVECKQHPNADKLLQVLVDIGEAAPRQILAGIAEFFTPETLIGKQVTIVANLAPRKMRGLESQGMILAVRSNNGLELLTPSGPVVSGSKVS